MDLPWGPSAQLGEWDKPMAVLGQLSPMWGTAIPGCLMCPEQPCHSHGEW